MEREVLLRVVREGSVDKVTFKQETKRKIQGKACSYLEQEHSRRRAGRCQALGRICSLTLLEPMCPQSLCSFTHLNSLPVTSFMSCERKSKSLELNFSVFSESPYCFHQTHLCAQPQMRVFKAFFKCFPRICFHCVGGQEGCAWQSPQHGNSPRLRGL